jgi:predicted lipoprotein with Yx(FWY)xxD motif
MNKRYSALAVLALVLGLALAACGGSSGSTSNGGSGEAESSSASSSSGGGVYGSYGNSSSESEASSSTSGEAAPVALGTATGVGKVLVDSNGLTLYYFEKDKKGSGTSTCSGPCAAGWPPLTTSGEPEAMAGVDASMLGTIERSDGTMQVTYNGWPLYTFVEDKKPGEDNGTDVKAFGAAWYPLHANGEKAGD